MKVLIVAKTRLGSGACIGGITFDGRSVRLIPAVGDVHDGANLEYAVGEVWDVDATPAGELIAPHVENVIVRSKRRMGPMSNPTAFVERHMPPIIGGPELLYEGLVQASPGGALYIAEHSGVPAYSTLFWRPDQPLERVDTGKNLRYRYLTPNGGRTLAFVGLHEPVDLIPAGALVRVSLAQWWCPEERPDEELRCYVQLSGYFLPTPAHATVRSANLKPRPADLSPLTTAPPPPRPSSKPSSHEVLKPSEDEDLPSTLHSLRSTPERKRSGPPSTTRALLKSVFGYDSFWPLQEEIVDNVLKGRDTLAVMPTGGGKSLCYQLPALIFDGLTVVISPLIALMQDQVDQLRELGIPAAFLNSSLDYRSYVQTMDRARHGQVKLLYTSPETLLRPETLVLLDQSRVACLAIDEAHCISQWGHDFRPEYRQLLPVRRRYPQAICLAFTATATQRVRQDIMDQLGFDAADTFVASFDRKNLHLSAKSRIDGLQQTLAFLDAHRDQSGIIYCSTRETVDNLAARLVEAGWPALPYHAGLDDATRQRNQRQFIRADVAIMVATIAFGMGINKPNVRFVLHFNLPKDVESYYQEIGRAGRDGLPADCLLLYGQKDVATIQYFIEEGAESERPGRTARLQAMLRYAQAAGCRRTPLLSYFGETFEGEPCNTCDRCLATETNGETIDLTKAARTFLSCIKDTGQIFGASHIAGVLRGSQSQKILQRRHDRVPAYGAGREYSEKQWRQFGQQFISEGLVEQDMEHGGLSLAAKGREVLAGKRTVSVAAPAAPAVQPSAAPVHDEALFHQLRTLRRELADAANLPPYVVFSDRSLVEMATYYPQTSERLLDIGGVGQVKLAKYGEPFLAVIREYCAVHGLKERPKVVRTPAALTGSLAKRRFVEVGELFASGLSIEQLQTQYGVQRSTIVGHLATYQREGGVVDVERVRATSRLTPDQQQRVLAVFDELGTLALTPVFEALEGTVAYEELHVMRVVYMDQTRESELEEIG